MWFSQWRTGSNIRRGRKRKPPQKLYKSLNWATNFGLHRVRCHETATQAYDLITVPLPGSLCLLKFQPPPPRRVAKHHGMGVYGGAWMYNSSYLCPLRWVVSLTFRPVSHQAVQHSRRLISILQVTNGGLFPNRIVVHAPGPGVHASWLSVVSQVTVLRWTPVYIDSRRFRQMPSVLVSSWRSGVCSGSRITHHNFIQTELVWLGPVNFD
jgi:hypothetical protein